MMDRTQQLKQNNSMMGEQDANWNKTNLVMDRTIQLEQDNLMEQDNLIMDITKTIGTRQFKDGRNTTTGTRQVNNRQNKTIGTRLGDKLKKHYFIRAKMNIQNQKFLALPGELKTLKFKLDLCFIIVWKYI